MAEISKIHSSNQIVPAGNLNKNFNSINEQLELLAGSDYASKIENLNGAISSIVDAKTYSWGQILSKPILFNPTLHSHSVSEINDLQALLNDKASIADLNSISTSIDGGNATSIYLETQIINCGGA